MNAAISWKQKSITRGGGSSLIPDQKKVYLSYSLKELTGGRSINNTLSRKRRKLCQEKGRTRVLCKVILHIHIERWAGAATDYAGRDVPRPLGEKKKKRNIPLENAGGKRTGRVNKKP